ncbi:MAG: hypothetical protein HQ464_02595 [Planctomycetes bacterium]|nr:hypothetical protein [Planctomycetota bacterium]
MIADAHFRRNGQGRESIAAPGEIASLAAKFTPTQHHWGKLTSTRPAEGSEAELQLLAFRLGVRVELLRRFVQRESNA